jgi:chromosome segregation ATPase
VTEVEAKAERLQVLREDVHAAEVEVVALEDRIAIKRRSLDRMRGELQERARAGQPVENLAGEIRNYEDGLRAVGRELQAATERVREARLALARCEMDGYAPELWTILGKSGGRHGE